MSSDDFQATFQTLTGHPPFPWQEALYRQFMEGVFPASCNLPSGLGKTLVIAIWLIALISQPGRIPRRLVYVVNRRAVMDQATTEIQILRTNLPKLEAPFRDLAFSTLRGVLADDRTWSSDPARPAVICGTVQTIGSRLLFSGEGIGLSEKALYAGLLGHDALVIHDEAHLEPAFQDLLLVLENHQQHHRALGGFHVVEFSASPRTKETIFGLTEPDKKNPIVQQRMRATKTLALFPLEREKQELTSKIVERALARKDLQRRVLVCVSNIETLATIAAALQKEKQEVAQLTGTLRGWEQDKLVEDPIFRYFLADAAAPDKTVFLLASGGCEVGSNLSADDLVCDLVPFEYMMQRLGHVNRFGEPMQTPAEQQKNSRIDVIHPTRFTQDAIDQRLSQTLDLLQTLGGDGSTAALNALSPHDCLAAFSPKPQRLEVSEILLDAWALTTLAGKLPGRPPVSDYLHGRSPWARPWTKVAWRSEVAEITGALLARYSPTALLDAFPVMPHELLADRSDRIFLVLKQLLATADHPVWVCEADGTVIVTTLDALTAGGREALENKTLLLSPQSGGLEGGMLAFTGKGPKSYPQYDVSDQIHDDAGPVRLRLWNDPARPAKMKRLVEIIFANADDPDGPPQKTWHWYSRPNGSAPDCKSTVNYGLQRHLEDAKAFAQQMTHDLDLPAPLGQAVILAAQFHDLGKDRKLWQAGVGNLNYPSEKWAKSARRRATSARSTYRHELGSVLDAAGELEFVALAEDVKELVLHLIAAHHGRARPHFRPDEMFDDAYAPDRVRQQAREIPRRFARLQARYGRWGLAYLESLVRGADALASNKAAEVEP